MCFKNQQVLGEARQITVYRLSHGTKPQFTITFTSITITNKQFSCQIKKLTEKEKRKARSNLGNLEKSLPPRSLILLHSYSSACSDSQERSVTVSSSWKTVTKHSEIFDNRVDHKLHCTLHTCTPKQLRKRRTRCSRTLLSGRRCNNARTSPGGFKNDRSATQDSYGQVQK